MTNDLQSHFTLLDDLDARQDDVLGQLDALNGQIECLLESFNSQVAPPPEIAPETTTNA